ncbi:winged helix-turn-helix transcriptional regulator [Candidatus Woesearchaeota archaeon]|nr:winged helix-turn-helix transcriptional regulator [Candidatus Woesearchaeota archaeon]
MKTVCCGFFTTLANKTRLSILYTLREGDKSVNQIVQRTGFEQSLVSHNLKLLKHCSFVDSAVRGKQRIYSLNKKTIIPLFDLVDKHRHAFCKDQDCPVCNPK